MDCSPSGSSVHGISQAKLLEWVAIFWARYQTHISCIAGEFFTTGLPGEPLIESNAQLFNAVSQNQFSASIISVFLNRENVACPCSYSGWTGMRMLFSFSLCPASRSAPTFRLLPCPAISFQLACSCLTSNSLWIKWRVYHFIAVQRFSSIKVG